MYQVTISKKLRVRQGLDSPVRATAGLTSLVPDEGFEITLFAAIRFKTSQINERGWFVDTDAVEKTVTAWVEYLSSDKWTNLFEFRPTFEKVAEISYQKLSGEIPQLFYIELDNRTINVKTRYEGEVSTE